MECGLFVDFKLMDRNFPKAMKYKASQFLQPVKINLTD